jgi:hypothetical protein
MIRHNTRTIVSNSAVPRAGSASNPPPLCQGVVLALPVLRAVVSGDQPLNWTVYS